MRKSDIAAIEAWAKLADAYRQDVKDLQEQLNLLEIENANLRRRLECLCCLDKKKLVRQGEIKLEDIDKVWRKEQ